jgi:3-methyl-2-oxobutanoate hydroxymethyltransferase
MSVEQDKRRKVTVKSLRDKKSRNEMIVALGVYDSPMAAIADEVGFDLLINGNAGPMSLLGHPTPMTVRFDEQLVLTQAVSRVARWGLVVAHLPYMTYTSASQGIRHAARLVAEGGAEAVKCEGNVHTARIVEEIARAGVPVMGHMGMQASRKLEQSGYGFKGRLAQDAARIVEDTRAFVEAGVFGIILEYVPAEITDYLARTLPIPIISVGGGPSPDGIYIASSDVVGYSAFPKPKHEGSFTNVRPLIQKGLRQYKDEVLAGTYPYDEFVQHMAPQEHERFLALVERPAA